MKYLIISLSLFGFIACNNASGTGQNDAQTEEHQAQDAQWRKVMDIHDEVMPKMGLINSLKRDLKAIVEEQADEQESLTPVIVQLDQAEESMMDWMFEFQPLNQLRDSLDHAAIIRYLQDEEVRIMEVKNEMLQSIADGQKTLEKYQSE